MRNHKNIQWAMILILLSGALLRWSAIGPMSDMLSYDEAYYGLDALSLIQHPRLTPFLPANHGRESLWCYLLIPFISLWGARPFALRLAATMVGILTLAVTYRLGTEVLNRRAACWATLALAICQWHVHQSRTAIRAILLPLVGALAFWALFQAHRTDRRSLWALAGVWMGLLLYTYFSSLVWIAYAILPTGWWLLRGRKSGPAVTLVLAGLLFLPMLLYGLLHPQDVLQRPEAVRVSTMGEFWDNVRVWGKAWFHQGDPDARYNPISRPVVDTALIPLFLAGIIALWWAVRRRWYILWIVGLMAASLLPSLLTTHAPHFLRAVGLVVPVALVVGAGAWGIEETARRFGVGKKAFLIPAFLFTLAGWATLRDCNERWLHHPEVFTLMEQHVNHASNFIRENLPSDTPVYFSPFALSHPVIAFRRADLAPRPVGAFDSHICMVVPERPAVYVSVTLYEPDFGQKLSRWADTSVLFQDPQQNPPRYTVFQAVPKPEFLRGEGMSRAVFGDKVEMRWFQPISPTAKAGDVVTVYLGLRALQPLEQAYSVFVHLYGDPPPWEGGTLWSQGDSLVCEPYPSLLWRTDEWVLQPFFLPIPAEVPAGRYEIAVGMYEAPAGARLPVRSAEGSEGDFIVLQNIEVR